MNILSKIQDFKIEAAPDIQFRLHFLVEPPCAPFQLQSKRLELHGGATLARLQLETDTDDCTHFARCLSFDRNK